VTYREHIVGRPRTSLDRVLGEAATTDAELRAMARRAWIERGVVVFLPCDLERMPDFARLMVEGEMQRLHGARINEKAPARTGAEFRKE